MNYQILDPEVQKTYYYVKRLLDSQRYTQQLGLYLRLGQKNQPEEWKGLGWGYALKPVVTILFIIGIVLIFTRHILFGIGVIVTGILISSFFGGKIKKYLVSSPSVESASQKIGSHRLMRIVADEMSKGSSMEQIAEALKKEIQETLQKKMNLFKKYESNIDGILKEKAKVFAPIMVEGCSKSVDGFSIRLANDGIKNLSEEEKCKVFVEQVLFIHHLADRIILEWLKDTKKADIFIDVLLRDSQDYLLNNYGADKYIPDFQNSFISAFRKDQIKYRNGTWVFETAKFIQLFCVRMCLLIKTGVPENMMKPLTEATEVLAENIMNLYETLWNILKKGYTEKNRNLFNSGDF